MHLTTCDMCLGHGKIIRFSDGRLIRCPKCFGYSKPAPPAAARRPAEILERTHRARQQGPNRMKPQESYAGSFGSLWKRMLGFLRSMREPTQDALKSLFKP